MEANEVKAKIEDGINGDWSVGTSHSEHQTSPEFDELCEEGIKIAATINGDIEDLDSQLKKMKSLIQRMGDANADTATKQIIVGVWREMLIKLEHISDIAHSMRNTNNNPT